MKKYIVSALSILALIACQKEGPVVPETTESSFDLFANITKTTLNGYEVDWENGDILYLVTSDETWGKPKSADQSGETIGNFTYDGTKFSSNQTIADGSYTFRAIYADKSQRTYHRGASTTHSLQNVQTQDCSAPTAHIKKNDALVGKFDATTPLTAGAAVAMRHIYTIMKVDIKNSTATEATINSFTMKAKGADLAGIFTVNYDNTPIDVTIKQNGSSSITVNLTNGTVAKDATIPVYFVMAPLADYSGEVTLSVTDSNDNVYTTTKTVTNKTFAAGTLNKTGFTISDANLVVNTLTKYYTATFEDATGHRTSGTNSYTDNTYTTSGVTWTLKYADSVTSGTPLEGSANITARIAASTTNIPTAITGDILNKTTKTVKKVSFLSKLGSKASVKLYYSTNGSNWTEATFEKDAIYDATYGYSAEMSVSSSNFYLKFEWSRTGTAKADSQLDKVTVFTD